MAVQSRDRKPRPGERKADEYKTHRVLWRLNGERTGKWQSVTVGTTKRHRAQAEAVDAILRDTYGYRIKADDPRVLELLGRTPRVEDDEPADDDDPAPTVRELVTRWVMAPKRQKNPNTARTYGAVLKLLGDDFGGMPATAVTREHINQWFGALDRGETTRNGKPAAVSSQAQRLVVLKGSLGEHVPDDAWDDVAYNAPRHVTQDKALTEAQVRDLIANATDSDMALPITVGAWFGLRPGEICGLRVGSIDLANRLLHVTEQVRGDNRKAHGFVTEPVKHGAIRTLQINDEQAEALALVSLKGDREPAFTHGDGDYWNYDQWSAAWARLVAKTPSVPEGTTPHALRHTSAIYWLSNGVPLGQVRKWLGHSTVGITDESYGQFSTEAGRAFMDRASMTL